MQQCPRCTNKYSEDFYREQLTREGRKCEMKINKEWHLRNKMPQNPTFEMRVQWHLEHQKNCNCRPIPENLLEEMKEKGVSTEKESKSF